MYGFQPEVRFIGTHGEVNAEGEHCVKDHTIPLTLISILADGEFHSGEQLGEQLGMSRAAINKHIQTLRDWGVDVFTVPGKGYSLPEPIHLLDEKKISQEIDHGRVTVLPVIDSTNQYLLDRLDELTSGDACVAEYQQAGRGRRGRKWFSPFGANLYLSMYWRLEQGPAAAIGLSLVIGIVIAGSSAAARGRTGSREMAKRYLPAGS